MSLPLAKPEYRLFIVYLWQGRAEGCVFHDEPRVLPRGTIYKLRLDKLDRAERWCTMSLGQLMTTWLTLARLKRLPAQNA